MKPRSRAAEGGIELLVQVLANADGNLLCACLPEACCPVRALLFGTLEGALATFSQNLHEFSPKKVMEEVVWFR